MSFFTHDMIEATRALHTEAFAAMTSKNFPLTLELAAVGFAIQLAVELDLGDSTSLREMESKMMERLGGK